MPKDIGFILSGIKVEQFATFKDTFTEKNKTELATGIQFRIEAEQKTLISQVLFSFEQKKKPFIKIEVSCHFAIKPESWDSFQHDEAFVIPEGFARHLVMLTIGTSRGVLHAKTEGTIFNSFLIPTINVNELIKEDVVIKPKS